MSNNKALIYFKNHYDLFLEKLNQLIAIPSISTDPNHVDDILKTASFLKQYLISLGFKNAEIFSTDRHPIIFGELKSDNLSAKTLLIYGHYDVQPVDPIDEWISDPFTPTIQGDYLYARGSSDMKGQIMACLFAIDSLINTSSIPINIKILFEGEEEIGSPSLDKFLEGHKEMLTADFVLNPDAGMISPDKPTIVYGLRGLAYFELIIRGPKADLHSGLFGGIVHNPAIVLSELIAGMHDKQGKITLPRFYDSVRPLTEVDKLRIASVPLKEDRLLEITGVRKFFGEAGYALLERTGARPTLDVNGLYSGFIGEGAKTIIPAFAKAKISCRLVPDQDPEHVYKQLLDYLISRVPETVSWELIKMSGAPAYLTDNIPGIEKIEAALEAVWNTPVAYKREGGSVPVATSFKNILGLDSILTGFGLPDDQIHSPNERMHLPTWQKGTQALILFMASFE